MLFRSFLIAISTYSRIPVPHMEFKKEDMKYSMCFFPMVGIIIGVMFILAYKVAEMIGLSSLFTAVILGILPVLISGGIHMDGYMDTIDALRSYADKEKKLSILKDPHSGAFAIIGVIVYFLAYIGIVYEIIERQGFVQTNSKPLYAMAFVFIYSRILSGLSVLIFKKAKTDGMAASFAEPANRTAPIVLFAELILCIACSLYICREYALILIVMAFCTFIYYRLMSYKQFGGINGDTAGYFLEICELMETAGILVLMVIR